MTSNSELADELIEELVRGNYESYYLSIQTENYKVGIGTDLFNERASKDILNLNAIAIQFRQENDPSKRDSLALTVINSILHLRLTGVLRNNPNTYKHLEQERDF